jgi:hypothetical protein
MTSANEILLAVLVALALLAPARARAEEPTPGEITAADALFAEAKELADKGDYARACPKLEQSQKLAPGSGTLLNLADCYENLGRTATAWATFRAAAAAARAKGNADREEEAGARAAALEPRLARLRIDVAPDVRVKGLLVRRGDVLVDESLWGVAVPVDPGEHVLSAEAPEHRGFTTRITIAESADLVAFPLPALEPLPGTVPVPAPLPLPWQPPPPAGDSGDAQRIFAVVLGGVGLVAIGVGLGFGFDALAKNSDSEDAGCDGDNVCTPEGLDLRDTAVTEAHLATGLVAAGLAHGVAALVVALTAPTRQEAWEITVAPTHGGLVVGASGAF